MTLIAGLAQRLQQLDARQLRRFRRTADTPAAPHMQVDGVPMLAFCSNDYLGLASHPCVVEALRDGAARYGAGSGASHLISGHSRAHAQLEARLAEFMSPYVESARALYFGTGYLANLAVLSVLADRDTELFSESLNHASLIDGARLSRASVRVYPHADVAALDAMLGASSAATKLVVTDSVFSMDGDIAPLPALLAACERHGAWLVVDDAHGFGVLGQHGRGVLEHLNLRSPHLVYMGTLGKAAGVAGAFVAGHETVIEWLLQRGRPYIYTTAAPPAVPHALLTSIELIEGEEGGRRRTLLQRLNSQFRSALGLQKWRLHPSDTPIQPVIIGENEPALRAAARLFAQGIWVPAIRPPTVPAGTARLRVTLSAAHTESDVTQLVAALHATEQDLNMEGGNAA
jgi:8-amino-7-oxononanoate synthase